MPVTCDVGIQCNLEADTHNIEVQCELLSSQDFEDLDPSFDDMDGSSDSSDASQDESQMDDSYEEIVTHSSDDEDEYEGM